MIKAKAGNTLFFGLSEMNVKLLKEGRPIAVPLSDVGLPITIILFYGVTEEAMRADMQKLVGPQTVVLDTRKKPH